MNPFIKVCLFVFIALKSGDTDTYFSQTLRPSKKVKLLSSGISFIYCRSEAIKNKPMHQLLVFIYICMSF